MRVQEQVKELRGVTGAVLEDLRIALTYFSSHPKFDGEMNDYARVHEITSRLRPLVFDLAEVLTATEPASKKPTAADETEMLARLDAPSNR